MKALRLGFLTALLTGSAFAAVPVIPPQLANLAGNYQALLYTQADDAGSPTALVTLTLTNKGALTGKLTTEENKTYAFKTTLNYEAAESPEEGAPIGTATQATAISIVRGKDLPNWNLSLSITDFEEADADSLAVNLTLGDEPAAETENGFKQITFAKGALAYAAAGAYTAAFELADEPGQNDPTGSGYATVTIDAKGLLKLTGKTGDGTAITASLPAGPGYRYVAYLNPYKRINSLFAGKITLTERTSGGFHAVPVSGDGYDFQWKKSSLLPKTTDKSYRAGFGPLDVLLTMEPWTVPGKNETINDALGLGIEKLFNFALDSNLNATTYSKFLPSKLALTSQNTLRVAVGGAGSPAVQDEKAWAKIFTGKVDPKTGKVTITVNIEDTVSGKIVKRKVGFEGVMLKLEPGNDAPLSYGHFTMSDLVKNQPAIFGAYGFTGPVSDDQAFVVAAGTAGNYTFTMNGLLSSNAKFGFPSGAPKFTATGTPYRAQVSGIKLAISSDLRSVTFNGRTVKLLTYPSSADTTIIYSDATTSFMNNITVEVHRSLVTGMLTSLSVSYNQFKYPNSLSASYTTVSFVKN